MMKTIRTFFILIITVAVTLLYFMGCDVRESIDNPCGDENIIIKLNGIYTLKSESNKVIDSNTASGAVVRIYKKTTSEEDNDLLIFEDKLDYSGELAFIPEASGCGISNIYIEATYFDTKNEVPLYFSKEYEYLCCDTDIEMSFIESMKEVVKVDVNCAKIDTTINLSITNDMGACTSVEADNSDLFGNKLIIEGDGDYVINVSELVNLDSVFYVDVQKHMKPQPDEDGFVNLSGGQFSVLFGMVTDSAASYDLSVTLPVSCINEDGSVQSSGEYIVNIQGEVCDYSIECFCPVNEFDIYLPVDEDYEVASIQKEGGQDFAYSISALLGDIELNDGCSMYIDRIERADNTSESVYDNEIEVWDIVSPASSEFPISVDDFNDFEVVANFDPVSVERMEQKFNVFYNVVSEDDDAEIKECLFSFTLNGKGCNDVCPSILLGINTKAELLNNGASETIYSDDTVSFSHGDVIRQEMNDVSTLINSCVSFIDSDDDKLLKYRLIMPEDEDLCSGAYVKLEKDFTSESVFFTVNNPEDRIYLTEEDEYEFSINFYPPTVAEDFDSDIDNDDIYKATYVLNAYSNDDRNICSIEIEVIQEVQQVNINMTDMLPLFSFSQISDMMSEPVRKVYEIGYHRDDKQWGRFRNMRSNSKKVGDHYVPNENSGTFYFDVDDPTNLTLEQYPDLYLFNSSSSAFNYITSYPVDNFITTDNFVDYQDKLVESVFSTDGFSHDGVNFTFNPGAENGQMWNNSMHASEFSPGNGIPINVGDVFIIWSKDVAGSRISGLNPDDIGGYCKVAFLYISGKHHGKDGENTHHISSVDFNVAYPIQVIQGK